MYGNFFSHCLNFSSSNIWRNLSVNLSWTLSCTFMSRDEYRWRLRSFPSTSVEKPRSGRYLEFSQQPGYRQISCQPWCLGGEGGPGSGLEQEQQQEEAGGQENMLDLGRDKAWEPRDKSLLCLFYSVIFSVLVACNFETCCLPNKW